MAAFNRNQWPVWPGIRITHVIATMHVDWVGELATESITLCGGANEDSGTKQTLCPNCAQVRDALNVCGRGVPFFL